MTRRFRSSVALLVMFALAFAQLAVAAHACPYEAGIMAQANAAHAEEHGACPDMDNANICSEHCAFGTTSVDTHPLAPPAPALVALPWRARIDAGMTSGGEVPDWHLARSTAPPPAILFCVIRI